jgi:hypothetical protein
MMPFNSLFYNNRESRAKPDINSQKKDIFQNDYQFSNTIHIRDILKKKIMLFINFFLFLNSVVINLQALFFEDFLNV